MGNLHSVFVNDHILQNATDRSSETMNSLGFEDPFSLLRAASRGQQLPTDSPVTAFLTASVAHPGTWVLHAKTGAS